MSHGQKWLEIKALRCEEQLREVLDPWESMSFRSFPPTMIPQSTFINNTVVYTYFFTGGKPIITYHLGFVFLHFFATHKMVILEMLFWRVYSILQYNIRNNVFLFIVYFVDWLKRNDPGFHSRFRQRQYPAWRNSCGCPGGCLGIVAGQRSP